MTGADVLVHGRLATITTQQWNGTAYVPADSWTLTHDAARRQTDGTRRRCGWPRSRAPGWTPPPGAAAVLRSPAVTFTPVQELPTGSTRATACSLYRNRIGQITTETGVADQRHLRAARPVQPGRRIPPAAVEQHHVVLPRCTGAVHPRQRRARTGSTSGRSQSVHPVRPGRRLAGPVHLLRLLGARRGTTTTTRWSRPSTAPTGSGAATRTSDLHRQSSDPQTETETTYYQGMSDDNNTTAVTLDRLPGRPARGHQPARRGRLETTATTTAQAAPVDHSQIYSYWVSPRRSRRTRAGLPDLTANATGQVEKWTRQAITDAGTASLAQHRDRHQLRLPPPPPLLRAARVHLRPRRPVPTRAADLHHHHLRAARTPALNLVGLPAETETDAAPCGGASPGGASAPGVRAGQRAHRPVRPQSLGRA